MKQISLLVTLILMCILLSSPVSGQAQPTVKLGNEVLLSDYLHLVSGKRVGLVTNQTGVTSTGQSLIDVLANHPDINLTALYAPEHGLDGQAKAGEYVSSYTHPQLNIPVYSLYGQTRKPTPSMLQQIDVLLFDIQDIGARTYTYMSTLNYCLVAAQENNKQVLVLDRPNPLGGMQVEGPVMEDRFISFVGVDNLPMAHGMTAGELALFFNRNIGANVRVIPMQGYSRNMVFTDTGLPWVQTSPNVPDIDSCFGYMATGLAEGTGVHQADRFKWVGGAGLNSQQFADHMNAENLPGVQFAAEARGSSGGVRLIITDYYSFNPARTGIYAVANAFLLADFNIPKSTTTNIVMFDKVMGTDKFGTWLEQGLTPQQIEQNYRPALQQFMAKRQHYLMAEYGPVPMVRVNCNRVQFDTDPHLDENSRLIVPVRAMAQALGATVHWFENQNTVMIKGGSDTITFTIGNPSVQINDQIATMDTIPVIVNGRTMVPARFASEYLNAHVRWDPNWHIAFITSN